MFELLGLDHIVLYANHPDKMIAFYCDILGCHVERKQEKIGLTQLRAGDALIDIMKNTQIRDKMQVNMAHFCLRITPFNAEFLKEYFNQHNITISRLDKRSGAQDYGWSCYIHDPEGNEIELKAPIAPNKSA